MQPAVRDATRRIYEEKSVIDSFSFGVYKRAWFRARGISFLCVDA